MGGGGEHPAAPPTRVSVVRWQSVPGCVPTQCRAVTVHPPPKQVEWLTVDDVGRRSRSDAWSQAGATCYPLATSQQRSPVDPITAMVRGRHVC